MGVFFSSESLWKAPEQLRNPILKVKKEGDIYAVAIIMQEVMMRGVPFEYERKHNEDIQGKRMDVMKEIGVPQGDLDHSFFMKHVKSASGRPCVNNKNSRRLTFQDHTDYLRHENRDDFKTI